MRREAFDTGGEDELGWRPTDARGWGGSEDGSSGAMASIFPSDPHARGLSTIQRIEGKGEDCGRSCKDGEGGGNGG